MLNKTSDSCRLGDIRGSRGTVKLPMEFLVNTLLPFLEKYTLLRITVLYF